MYGLTLPYLTFGVNSLLNRLLSAEAIPYMACHKKNLRQYEWLSSEQPPDNHHRSDVIYCMGGGIKALMAATRTSTKYM